MDNADYFRNMLVSCRLCPRLCGVNRAIGQKGYCGASSDTVVYSYLAHRGEEPPISGRRGSGTIFFSHCTMKCVYCQNYTFSQLGQGNKVTVGKLSDMMMLLQGLGCHNINLVSPTHYIPQTVEALVMARKDGLTIPIAYNTSGYESVDTIKALEGLIDIYMPDMRYSDDDMARKYSDAPGYVKINRSCVKEMQRQAGCLKMDADGIASKGILVRLLALPGDISGIVNTMNFIRDEVSPETYLSIMSQYYPTYRALEYKELSAGITAPEYANVVDAAAALGLNNGWVQDPPAGPDDRFLGVNIDPRT